MLLFFGGILRLVVFARQGGVYHPHQMCLSLTTILQVASENSLYHFRRSWLLSTGLRVRTTSQATILRSSRITQK